MKQDLRVAVTKRMIQEALLRLLENTPIDKVRINELCAESGVNRATFYRHYETVRDVLWEIEEQITMRVFPLSPPPKNIVQAQEMLEKACAYLYDQKDLMKILFRCNAESDLAQKANEFYQQILQLRTQEPDFANIDDATVKILVSLLGGGCYWLLRQWIVEDIPKTPSEIAAIVCNVFRWPDPNSWSQNEILR